jgi:hypothetical protein
MEEMYRIQDELKEENEEIKKKGEEIYKIQSLNESLCNTPDPLILPQVDGVSKFHFSN